MLTVIEDAGPRLGEVALFLAAIAAMLLAMKDYFQRLRSMMRGYRLSRESSRSGAKL